MTEADPICIGPKYIWNNRQVFKSRKGIYFIIL